MKSIKNLSLAITIKEIVSFIFIVITLLLASGVLAYIFYELFMLAGDLKAAIIFGFFMFFVTLGIGISVMIVPFVLQLVSIFFGIKTIKSYGTEKYLKNAKLDAVIKLVVSCIYFISVVGNIGISVTSVMSFFDSFGIFFCVIFLLVDLLVILFEFTFVVLSIFYTVKVLKPNKKRNSDVV